MSDLRTNRSFNNGTSKQPRQLFQPLIPNNLAKTCNSFNPSPRNSNNLSSLKSKNVIHPLEFYAQGRVENKSNYKTFYEANKGYKSTGADILDRNDLSIRNRNYEKLKNYKNYSVIQKQNIPENNYMKVLNQYNKFEEYKKRLYPNLTNHETFNITKEKLFAIDEFSEVKRGKQLSKKDFVEKKSNVIKGEKGNDFVVPEVDKQHEVYRNETGDYESKFYRTFVKERKCKSLMDMRLSGVKKASDTSNSPFIFKDPEDRTVKKLDPNNLFFDKTRTQMLRQKKWWKIQK